MKSSNRPPLIRKILQFITLLHGKKLECGSGYLLVSRAVSRGNEACLTLDSSILRSEIAMGVTLILRIKEDPNKCIMITVNHLVSQIPSFLGKITGSIQITIEHCSKTKISIKLFIYVIFYVNKPCYSDICFAIFS